MDEKYIPHFRRIVPYSEWGRKARREGGGTTLPCQGRAPYPTLEHAEPYERVSHELAYNSETNGDGVKMFNLGRVRPS